MKNTFKFLLLILVISAKAQTPVIASGDYKPVSLVGNRIKNAYYKDTKNELDPFIGTYLYTNGTTSLKIVLQKKIQSYEGGYYYEDVIVGENQYIENGVEKANKIPSLSNVYSDESRNHTIRGSTLVTGKNPGCDDCAATEKRLMLGVVDKVAKGNGSVMIRRIVVGGKAAIEFSIGWHIRYYDPAKGETPGGPVSIPDGSYIMIKQ